MRRQTQPGAAADTLHTAARVLGSPEPRRAADSYDRAARAPYGQIPQATLEGKQLRAAARLLAMAGPFTADTTLTAVALLANLAALAAAVAELRQAHQHAAQAAAAHDAATHLHRELQLRLRSLRTGDSQQWTPFREMLLAEALAVIGGEATRALESRCASSVSWRAGSGVTKPLSARGARSTGTSASELAVTYIRSPIPARCEVDLRSSRQAASR